MHLSYLCQLIIIYQVWSMSVNKCTECQPIFKTEETKTKQTISMLHKHTRFKTNTIYKQQVRAVCTSQPLLTAKLSMQKKVHRKRVKVAVSHSACKTCSRAEHFITAHSFFLSSEVCTSTCKSFSLEHIPCHKQRKNLNYINKHTWPGTHAKWRSVLGLGEENTSMQWCLSIKN